MREDLARTRAGSLAVTSKLRALKKGNQRLKERDLYQVAVIAEKDRLLDQVSVPVGLYNIILIDKKVGLFEEKSSTFCPVLVL